MREFRIYLVPGGEHRVRRAEQRGGQEAWPWGVVPIIRGLQGAGLLQQLPRLPVKEAESEARRYQGHEPTGNWKKKLEFFSSEIFFLWEFFFFLKKKRYSCVLPVKEAESEARRYQGHEPAGETTSQGGWEWGTAIPRPWTNRWGTHFFWNFFEKFLIGMGKVIFIEFSTKGINQQVMKRFCFRIFLNFFYFLWERLFL